MRKSKLTVLICLGLGFLLFFAFPIFGIDIEGNAYAQDENPGLGPRIIIDNRGPDGNGPPGHDIRPENEHRPDNEIPPGQDRRRASVPEPSTLLLLAGGVAGLAVFRKKIFR
jgi:hypothetical protein